ncbi:g3766 [Coccomyxa elongata]
MEVCCICHDVIQVEREAYAEPCFHRFHQECILRWSEVQLAKPLDKNQPPLIMCPLCKQPYASFIYDCRDRSYRRHNVLKQTSQDPVGDAASLLLSPAQRRRRSLYFPEAAAEPANDQGVVSVGNVSGKACDGIEVSQLRPSLVERPAVSAWLRREVQALLMEEDVELVAQHVLGTVRSLSSPAATNLRGRPTVQKVSLSRAEWVEAVAAAAKPYIFGNAAQFAGHLWAFIASGMSVAAHDAAVFGTDEAPVAAVNTCATEFGVPSNRYSSEGSSSQSRDEDEEWDVVSDDSAAYLPMVVEALHSTAASRKTCHKQCKLEG